jgi:hypothetical protein
VLTYYYAPAVLFQARLVEGERRIAGSSLYYSSCSVFHGESRLVTSESGGVAFL